MPVGKSLAETMDALGANEMPDLGKQTMTAVINGSQMCDLPPRFMCPTNWILVCVAGNSSDMVTWCFLWAIALARQSSLTSDRYCSHEILVLVDAHNLPPLQGSEHFFWLPSPTGQLSTLLL